MVAASTWFRYIASKLDYSVSLSRKVYIGGQIADTEIFDTIWKNLFQGRLTFLHWNKGEEMASTIGTQGGTLLVRKIPAADPTRVYVGDVVVLKDPLIFPPATDYFDSCRSWFHVCLRRVYVGDVVVLKDPLNAAEYLVRRLAAVEGYEMASTDEKDEPFVLEKDQCWVLADNESLKPKESYDSRTFGPVTMTNIVGRVIYCLRNAVDHGPVNNSNFSARQDSHVLEVELDVDEMAKNHKA